MSGNPSIRSLGPAGQAWPVAESVKVPAKEVATVKIKESARHRFVSQG